MSPLEQRILANLDDDEPRLVLADQLQAEGDPRGEFISVQCELARLGCAHRPPTWDWVGEALSDPEAVDDRRVRKLRGREQALLTKHGEQWSAEVAPFTYFGKLRFERGFIGQVQLNAGAKYPDGRRWMSDFFAAAPMCQRLSFGTLPRGERALEVMAARELGQIIDLELNARLLGPMVASSTLTGLRRLSLSGTEAAQNNITIDWAPLYEWPLLAHPSSLGVNGASLDVVAFRRLLDATGPLVELQIRHSKIGAKGCGLLADSRKLGGLQVLALLANGVGDEGARILADSPRAATLRALDLRQNQIGTEGARAIGNAFPEVRTLDLTGNRLGRAGVEALAEGTGLGQLYELCLQQTRLDDEAIEALARSPLLGRVRVLSLRTNQITDAGARALAASPHTGRLQQVNLNNNKIGAAGKTALKKLKAKVLVR